MNAAFEKSEFLKALEHLKAHTHGHKTMWEIIHNGINHLLRKDGEKDKSWKDYINFESESGEWDIFNRKDHVEICRFEDDKAVESITCTKIQFQELCDLLTKYNSPVSSDPDRGYPCTCFSDIERAGCKELCAFNLSLMKSTDEKKIDIMESQLDDYRRIMDEIYKESNDETSEQSSQS